MIGVSACLLGVSCRYDGGHKKNDEVVALCGAVPHIAMCPELIGGFPCPREACDVENGCGEDALSGKSRVLTKSGADVTERFVESARRVLEMCRRNGITEVHFKSKSPSCGENCGVTAALLKKNGIKVYQY